MLVCLFFYTSRDGSRYSCPGALLPRSPAGFCRTLPQIDSTEDPQACPQPAGSASPQAAFQARGPDLPAAGLGVVPTKTPKKE